ncbi:MAG: N-acetylglucosamine-6-phosphate deacetylase [Acidobacteria bacterium]|nr:N-acetylglucosamine-6-phosphate deacetylase [Acidobacteriota bacterium]
MTSLAPKRILLDNARIITRDKIVERGALLVEGGKISQVLEGEAARIGGDALERDCKDLTLWPGLIDVHIHGAAGVDTMNARADDLLRVSKYLASQGVTGWLPTLVPAEAAQYASAVRSIEGLMRVQADGQSPSGAADTRENGARVLGLHYEGPFVSDAQCGALHTNFFREYSTADDLTALQVPNINGSVKMMTVAPEIAGGVDLVRELTANEWVVSLGHTRASLAVLDQAFTAGARHLTHFMNAMPQLHHRNPGPVGWGLSRNDVSCDIIADGVHLDPLMLRLLLQIKSPERLTLISDAIAAAGLGDGDYQIWGETISVSRGRTQNAHGSIAGSVITMLDAVRMMLSLGVSEVEAARMAATNPARLLRIDQDCGAIEEGKRADLVGLNREGKVQFTMVGGQFETLV